MFHSQDIQILAFLMNPQTSKSVTSPQILLHIRSFSFDCYFRILGSIKVQFVQILV